MSVLLKHVVLLLALVVCASAQPAPPLQPMILPVGSATVADLKGEVVLHSPKGDGLTAQRGLVLAPESLIETGKGSILLDLKDGSQALIKAGSHVVLKSPETGMGLSLELLLGKLIAKIQKRLGEAPPFRMGTPSAVITVRGTRFEVEVTKKKHTYVQVFEGVVEVQGLTAGSGSVLVRPGFSTGIDSDRGPQQPRNLTQELLDDSSGNRPGREKDGTGREGEGQQKTERENERPD